jgi:two-component system sensor histidine kinase UhpB
MPGPAALRDARILVVDDNDADARLIEAILRGNGYRDVTVETDSAAACELHRVAPFDLVILDLIMPGLDGFGLMQRLHALDPSLPVPVIAVTAEPDHMKRALEEGARDFIGKPLRKVELISRVRNALELGALLKAARRRGEALEQTLEERTRNLRDVEHRFGALVEQSVAGVYIEEEGRFVYANPSLCDWLGYTMEELHGMPSLDLVHPDDRERLQHARMLREAGLPTPPSAMYRMIARDGRIVHLSVSGRLIFLDGHKVLFGVAQDVTDREHAREELERANERLRSLSRRMLDLQEEERRNISRELHDDVGQSLLALNIALHRLDERIGPADRALAQECIEMTNVVHERVREMSLQLHPPHLDQLGLHDALRWLVSRHRHLTGLDIEFRLHGSDRPRAAPAVEAACYRICQEALSNATRHAQARHISVELHQRDGAVEIAIADDGVGFDEPLKRKDLVTSGSLGLISMEERARLAGGRLEIRTRPGAGTRVAASFPRVSTHKEVARSKDGP